MHALGFCAAAALLSNAPRLAAALGRSQAADFAIQEATLVASDASTSDYFGTSVSISGDTAVVGAAHDSTSGIWNGSAYVFVRSGSAWNQQAKLAANDPASLAFFGGSVSVSADTAVIGANGDDDFGGGTGSAYVFVRSSSAWTQQSKLLASDKWPNDYFGLAVSVSGDTAIIGAPGDDHAGGTDAGSAYVFVRSGSVWTQQAKLTASDAKASDQLGGSVCISGDTAVVGAQYDDHDGGLSSAGSAYVFIRSGSVWTEQAKLVASDSAASDEFGVSVSASGDTAVVGANVDDHGTGSAYVFVRSGGVWVQQAKLVASDADAFDLFGTSVAVSGETVIVGANGDDPAGSAYAFERSAGVWAEQAKLAASDAAPFDSFGSSVAVAGDTAVVGRLADDHAGGSDAGSACVFRLVDCAASLPSLEVVRLGTPPNPPALLPGLTSGPVIGSTWDPVIDHTSFSPAAIKDVLVMTPLSANLPSPLGTILCDIGTPPVSFFVAPPGVAFALAVPADCGVVGASLCTQGASIDAAGIELTNALDVTIGTF